MSSNYQLVSPTSSCLMSSASDVSRSYWLSSFVLRQQRCCAECNIDAYSISDRLSDTAGRLSVCLSVCHELVLCYNDSTDNVAISSAW